MAIRHGLAGQYGKHEAIKRYQRTIVVAMFSIVLGFGTVAFVTGYFWSRGGGWPGAAGMVAALASFAAMMKYLEPYMKLLGTERIKFLRGGQTEALVAWQLEHELEGDWHVFNGVKLESESDTDHVVVGPGGVFCISTKSHRGWFVGSADGLRRNRNECPFAQDALRQTAKLGARLKAVMGEGVPWIQAVLCVPFGYTDGDVFNGKVWLVHADDLTDRIAPEKPPKRLSRDQVARTVKAMEMIAADAAKVYERPAQTV